MVSYFTGIQLKTVSHPPTIHPAPTIHPSILHDSPVCVLGCSFTLAPLVEYLIRPVCIAFVIGLIKYSTNRPLSLSLLLARVEG
jgi:hypothetical protein